MVEEEEGNAPVETPVRHFTITHGDITLLQLNDGAIVNPSNTGLILGSGVSEQIARRAGPMFQQKLHTARSALYQNKLDLGRAFDTDAGQLNAKRLIHVSIVGRKKADRALITDAILNVYDLAERLELPVIAFPALGVGVAKFPLEEFLELFWQITLEELPRSESLEHVILCLYDENEFNVARDLAEKNQDDIPETIQLEIAEGSMWTTL
jgi:O-acetyl-ADP-ribose deacetylase (regulator of RNase III)